MALCFQEPGVYLARVSCAGVLLLHGQFHCIVLTGTGPAVSMALCFQEPGVYLARVSCAGVLLLHGQFHCIVLTGTGPAVSMALCFQEPGVYLARVSCAGVLLLHGQFHCIVLTGTGPAVSMALCFQEPGVYLARVSCAGVLLLHGQFHCIVLTGTGPAVSMALCFQEPGVYLARVSCAGVLLLHGQFHCIVLTGTGPAVSMALCFQEPGVYLARVSCAGVLLLHGQFHCIVLTGTGPAVSMALCFQEPGVYLARVSCAGVLLLHGQFHCIVLTASDTATVSRNMSAKRHGVCYEARLAGAKPRRVLCCLSPKQLIVKDYILKFIPKRITSFRLCPSTKLILAPRPLGAGPGGEFCVEDGVQAPLKLWAPERDLLAATFTHLLLANCGGEDTFKNKQDYFYSELRKLHARHPHDKLAVRVLRDQLLASSLKATKHFTRADWCKSFDVTFQGEQGVDWGGVRREWFSLLCGQLFDAKLGLFVSFHDAPGGLVHPNPNRPPHLKLKHFELAGKVVGKCLYECALGGSYRQFVRARLTRSFLAQIIGLRVHYRYFESDDPELYLSKIKYVLETDLDAADGVPELYFADDEYDAAGRLRATRELLPNGANIRVRNSTKLQYVDLLAQWRLAVRCRAETDAFLRGLALLVPDNLLGECGDRRLPARPGAAGARQPAG
ncbi:apoptosis-resistant E3 ubiquitin protein ligase 1 isoform X2 [Ostrinia furnacalis]|uniref:apoptosis-resistant E3 ubiquitin protein ligase 1 isoform X2 n=1 Tax=Ostrinia furnacalis TaxID=93504 RepID=UPI00103E047A|nr:apoptosis-resistant E3 ubiquitin protein ligase 1 isoform X2 [Ostrinia furnacalis]